MTSVPPSIYRLRYDHQTPKYISIYDKYVRNCSNHSGSVMTMEPVSTAALEMYFEVTVEEFSGTQICIGFAAGDHNCYQLPGDKAGIGFRSDGKLLDGSGMLGMDWAGCEPWGTSGDTIGVGINIVSGEVFCTKNGTFLCKIFKNVFEDYFNETDPLYPVISISGKGCVSVNFGATPFRFSHQARITEHASSRRARLQSMSVSEARVKDLVKEYLLYRGYCKTYDVMLASDIEHSSGGSASTRSTDKSTPSSLSLKPAGDTML